MNFERLSVWILGPMGAGKSTLLTQFTALGFEAIDPDEGVEAEMHRHGLSLDTRQLDAPQLQQFQTLRTRIAEEVWDGVAHKRASGRPLVYQITGNKPHRLLEEVEADRAAGYRVYGLGLSTPLALCEARNLQRARKLTAALIHASWADFRQGVDQGVYGAIFRRMAFELHNGEGLAARTWLQQMIEHEQGRS